MCKGFGQSGLEFALSQQCRGAVLLAQSVCQKIPDNPQGCLPTQLEACFLLTMYYYNYLLQICTTVWVYITRGFM